MKQDDIQRSVRHSRSDRAAGDAPSLGRVPRMPGTGLPKGARRKRKKSEGGGGSRLRQASKTIVVIWSVLLSLAVLAVLIGAVMIWVLPKIRENAKSAGKASAGPKLVAEVALPTEEAALAIVRRGLKQRDLDKMVDSFRLGSLSAPAAVGVLDGLEKQDGGIGQLKWLGGMDANGLSIQGVLVNFGKRTDHKPRNRIALLVPDETGNWKIDLEAFARTVSPGWDEISGSSAAAAQVRVYVGKDSYYNGPFSDDRTWICYGLVSPDAEEVLLGYCKVGSPQAAALAWMTSKDSALVRATLGIRRVDGGGVRQFEIFQVMAEDWVLGARPFDERFK